MSIQEVAKLAGVSPTTVSRIINNKARASEETIRAVRKSMAKLKYVPRPPGRRPGRRPMAGSGLRTGRIAVLFLDRPDVSQLPPFYVEMLFGIQRFLNAHDLATTVAAVNGPLPVEVRNQDVDAALLINASSHRKISKTIGKMPVVSLLGPPVSWCDSVTPDNPRAGALAAAFFLKRGHRHCAFFEDRSHSATQVRGRAFSAEMERGGGKVDTFGAKKLHFHRDRLVKLADQLLSTSPRPTGLFVPTDMLTAKLYGILYERGIRPQHDIELLSCNNEKPIIQLLHPEPAVVDIRSGTLGERAAEQLLWRVVNPDAPFVHLTVQPTLAER